MCIRDSGGPWYSTSTTGQFGGRTFIRIQGAEVTPGDEITLETIDALKPALLRSPDSPDFLYLLMPVRVS